jgi:succinate-semialdehyde dehydrogenase/glutarate-semialdehyde dehydrogenase
MSGDELARIGLVRPDLFRTSAFIGGDWIDGTEEIAVINPATGGTIAQVAALDRDAALAAVTAAEAALPEWRALPAGSRAQRLRRWQKLLLENADDLGRLLAAEQGKPLAEAISEVRYAAGFLAWFAEEARRTYGEIIPPHVGDKRLTVLREPIGIVAAVTPWNFPLAMVTRKAGPALAAGCTMVLKPSEFTPFSALALAVLAQEAGIPPGVFNVVTGEPKAIGDVLVEDPRIAKFTFTGSTAVGKALAARCMATVKRVSLELGGNAPFIVFDDADVGKAVDGAIASKFRNAGQTCVCANRLIVQDGIHDRFVEQLAARVSALSSGDALQGDAPLGPLINAHAVAKARAHVEDALGRGAKTVATSRPVPEAGFFVRATVLTDVPPDALLCREETFGPVAGIVRFHDEAEAIRLANDSRAGLAAYFYTKDLSRAHRVSEALQYGMVGLNTGLISTEVAPFGGVKESGFGREGGRAGIEDYLNTKLICTKVEPERTS